MPLRADREMLRRQKLRSGPDYSTIQLYTQEARDLLAMIAADLASLTAGEAPPCVAQGAHRAAWGPAAGVLGKRGWRAGGGADRR